MLKTKEEIQAWLEANNIRDYTIKPNMTVDVEGNVQLKRGLEEIPVQFDIVTGYFVCNATKLTSLKGCPSVVRGTFYCQENLFLTSLEGGPRHVGRDCLIKYNPELASLEGGPEIVDDNLSCRGNNLTDLYGSPKYIGGKFDFYSENHLDTLEGLGEVGERIVYNRDKIKFNAGDQFQMQKYKVRIK